MFRNSYKKSINKELSCVLFKPNENTTNEEIITTSVTAADPIVTFNSQGGTIVNSQTVPKNCLLIKPEDPLRMGLIHHLPRLYTHLFASINHLGVEIKRKNDETGNIIEWNNTKSKPGLCLINKTHRDREGVIIKSIIPTNTTQPPRRPLKDKTNW